MKRFIGMTVPFIPAAAFFGLTVWFIVATSGWMAFLLVLLGGFGFWGWMMIAIDEVIRNPYDRSRLDRRR